MVSLIVRKMIKIGKKHSDSDSFRGEQIEDVNALVDLLRLEIEDQIKSSEWHYQSQELLAAISFSLLLGNERHLEILITKYLEVSSDVTPAYALMSVLVVRAHSDPTFVHAKLARAMARDRVVPELAKEVEISVMGRFKDVLGIDLSDFLSDGHQG